ncbi:D-alanine--D-alanine ligase [Putridiphycobacter roseus]|uniref:D-alanine--D-alanine ligase n=1 Tax=Putridiphycobacter roseus TaxID=2219161 RepID=A0A2W1N1U3_9FLAO|nr:D-alanine--D-alanine ligase [Putridiphycobacter roseus]PZE18599.1 D-alanine--D-alanine ligase [Putridiphycobacter roseus]
MKKRIAVIFGGYSSEAIIAKKSAKTIFDNIDTDLYDPYLVEVTRDHWQVHIRGGVVKLDRSDFTYHLEDKTQRFDLAFITIHGTPGEDGKLQAYFDMIELPYVNSGCFASSLTFNKWACNAFLREFGIHTAKAILLRNSNEIHPIQIADELGFPCFVKPNDGGSSFGISKVKTLMEMPIAIEKAFKEGKEVVIESFIKGRELTCGLYFNGKEVIALPITEIISENEFFDFEAKYEGKSQEITPAEVSFEMSDLIKTKSKDIYKRIGLRGLARIDYLVTAEDEIYLIEVNTTPGMSAESLIPQQVVSAGLKLKNILTEIIIQN